MSRKTLTPALLTLGLAPLALVPLTAHAQAKPVLTTLHRFDGPHGYYPQSNLTLGTDGSFYGVAAGGSGSNGTVYKMTPGGQFTTLISFKLNSQEQAPNGSQPIGVLTEGTDGAFYGVTQTGGTPSGGGNPGAGTVFRITAAGSFRVVHSFSSATEGSQPAAGLTRAPDGSFYGTTSGGAKGYGTAFHITASGTLTVLHSFTSREARNSAAPLVFGPDGALYGTSQYGGANGIGAIFRLTTAGKLSTLHSFMGQDGVHPATGLTLSNDGNFYGVTFVGGVGFDPTNQYGGGDGVAYQIKPSGQFTLLHKFSADGHGTNPRVELTLGTDGLFYGTTAYGGIGTDGNPPGMGTVFVMTPAGAVTTLYKFHTDFDGKAPYAGVIFGPGGALYGTTLGGGTNNLGTLYKLTLP